MWRSGSAVGGPCTRAARVRTELRREGLVARLLAARLSTLILFLAPTVGYSNAMVTTMKAIGEELPSHVSYCAAQTATPNAAQKVLATFPIGSDCVERAESVDAAEPLAILLRVRDTAHVPHDVLTNAKADVTRIYREIGVDALWPTTESLLTESNATRQSALTVAIVSMEQAERMNSGIAEGRVGFAARTADGDGQLVYVIYDRVERLTGGNGVRRASMLAIAIAHEIGHLLLPSKAHSLRGLMRAEWTRADLQLAQRQLASFTPRQGELLRNRISVSRYRVTGKGIQKYLCEARR
jgi:hypothetical protein